MKELSKKHLLKENSPKKNGTYLLRLKAKEKPIAKPIIRLVSLDFYLSDF